MARKRLCGMAACIMAVMTMFDLLGTVKVCALTTDIAEQSEYDNLSDSTNVCTGEVWSETEYDGWQLTWSVGNFYDRLDRIEKDGIIYLYSYDGNGRRISKSSDRLTTTYGYNTEGYLVSETREDNVLEYSYEYDEETREMKLCGFTYAAVDYVYEYDENGSIRGIVSEGNEVARYTYNYGVCVKVLGIDENGTWVERSDDSEFVGNINPFRYTQKYLDSETGWYWMDRYYVQSDGRFVDGISKEKAEELREKYGDTAEIYCKIYTVGADIIENSAVNVLSDDDEMDIDYIARVLYCESSAYIPDQQAVAWCIKTRMNDEYGNQTTAIGTVTYNGEFAGPSSRTDFYSVRSGSSWISACTMAKELNSGKNPMPYKPSGYTEQKYFRSIGRMTELLEENAGTLSLSDSGANIYDLVIIGFGDIGNRTVLESDLVQGYRGIRNVFFKIVE